MGRSAAVCGYGEVAVIYGKQSSVVLRNRTWSLMLWCLDDMTLVAQPPKAAIGDSEALAASTAATSQSYWQLQGNIIIGN